MKIKYLSRLAFALAGNAVFCCLLLNLDSTVTLAQEWQSSTNEAKATLPDLEQISIPDSPALDLIGSDISIKPSETPRAFGLNILESIGNSEGSFPQNLAVEFAPYWWSSHPELTYEDYYSKTGFGEAIIETLSFSIGGGSVEMQEGEERVDGTRLALGMRFNLLAGKKNPALTDLEPNLERQVKDLRGKSLIECSIQFNRTPLALSLEYVRRFADEGDDRVVGVAEYRINNNYTVFATYGKTFEDNFAGDGGLVTLFGLKIGAGKSQVTQELLPSLPEN